MADRTAAALFAEIFEMLASDEPIDRRSFALKLWEQTGSYDFSSYQMGCDEALEKLGLARKGVDPKYPEDGEVILYGPDDEHD